MDAVLRRHRTGSAATEPVRAVERVSAADLAQLRWESPDAPMHITAVLELARAIDPAEMEEALARRVLAVPRLRQRVVRSSRRPRRFVWVDDSQFATSRHLSRATCPAPGDEEALLKLAATESTRPLPRDRPLWRAIHVSGLADCRDALVVVLHHAVADGIGGLAVLGQIADAAPRPSPSDLPRVARTEKLLEPVRSRPASFATASWHGAKDAVATRRLAASPMGHRRPPCSLNRPIGPERQVAVVRADLSRLAALAHRQHATVNDILLTAAAEALRTVLAEDGEDVSALVVSVPVSHRVSTSATRLGNHVGALPVRVPCTGPLLERLDTTAAATRKGRGRHVYTASIAPVLRLLMHLGLFQRFIRRQRLVNTFLTNVHGPAYQLSLVGVPITAVVPISPIAGNVTVAFTAFSYAGTLSVTVVADRDRWPDARPIAAALDCSKWSDLDVMTATSLHPTTPPGEWALPPREPTGGLTNLTAASRPTPRRPAPRERPRGTPRR
ncbi:MAG TPA: wax ester/triacylglycerol synthase domain-containing protein [Lapillicoccus sp.]